MKRFLTNGSLLFSIVSMVMGWKKERMGDNPFWLLFIDTMLNNNGPLLPPANEVAGR